MVISTRQVQNAVVTSFLSLLVLGCSMSKKDNEILNVPETVVPHEPIEKVVAQSQLYPQGEPKPLRWAKFTLEGIAFYRKSLHYENPAQFTIYNNGSWEFYAARIANYRRTGLGGQTWHLWLKVTYHGEYDCTGPILHAGNYRLYSIDYDRDHRNINRGGEDAAFTQKSSEIRCVKGHQQWE